MATYTGWAEFPGVERVVSCSYVRGHGITPGMAMLECAPQAGFVGIGGTLALKFTDGTTLLTLNFPACRVVQHDSRLNQSGNSWLLHIQDRRWKWEHGEIYGNYNIRMEDGIPDPLLVKTPRELATLCLQAMGETGFSVAALPNTARPEVNWEAENPAKALADLAESLGCRVVLRLNNTVALMVLGAGALLPSLGLDILEDSLTIDPPERPDKIVVVGGPTRYQQNLELEAVGLDVDGVTKPIDELSYRPRVIVPLLGDGWPMAQAPDFAIVRLQSGETAQRLAQQTVYRWYRIVTTDEEAEPLELEGSGLTMDWFDQILPLHEVQVEKFVDNFDRNKVKNEEPLVYGMFTKADLTGDNFGPEADYPHDYRLIPEKGIVEFADYAWRYGQMLLGESPTAQYPALFILRVAVSIRDPDLWSWVRYIRERGHTGTQWGTGARVLKHDEIVLDYIDGVVQNLAACDAEADYYIDAAEREYQLTLPQTVLYAGIVAIDLDGAIMQVEWSIGPQGFTTRASRNTEHSEKVTPYPMRRIWEALRRGGLDRIKQAVAKVAKAMEKLDRRKRRPLY